MQFITEQLDLMNWDNEFDYGAQESAGWASISDDNFIVYYKEDLNGVWKQNAQLTLRLANEAIPKTKKFFGKYTYPEDLNGRKLPFYLPNTPSGYKETNYKLYGCPFDVDNKNTPKSKYTMSNLTVSKKTLSPSLLLNSFILSTIEFNYYYKRLKKNTYKMAIRNH